MNMLIRRTALAAVDAVLLVLIPPDPGRLGTGLSAPHAWIARVGVDAVAAELAAAALWVAAAWLALGLLALAATTLPGELGRCAQQLARLVLPATLYRLAAGATGIGIVLAPAAAGAAPAFPSEPPVARAAMSKSSPKTSAPTWPTDPVPAPTWPTYPAPTYPAPTNPVPTSPAPAEPAPAQHPPAGRAGSATGESVLVHRGDSLWSIAAGQLPGSASDARIARVWPRWFAANRAVIGTDPALVRPGQILHPPRNQRGSNEENQA